jgi:LmbE family N-acetylglucosaminyl deacetylase
MPVRDVLILAAHSDDCVVCAGEYAIDALSSGRTVHVLYLTCGDYTVGTARAETRSKEALACWESLAVPKHCLTFLNLPCSPLGGNPVIHTSEVLDLARSEIAKSLKSLVRGAAVFLPAEGETHSDHRLLRKLAIEAMQSMDRPDLMILEAPEYNPYVSLWRTPVRGILTIIWLMQVPMLRKIVRNAIISCPASFVRGCAGLVRPNDPFRLAKKLELYRFFVSENPKLLVRWLGHPDLYRPLVRFSPSEEVRGYISVPPLKFGFSILALFTSLIILAVLTALAIADWSSQQDVHGIIGWTVAGSGVFLIVRTVKRANGSFFLVSCDSLKNLTRILIGIALVLGGSRLFRAMEWVSFQL